MKTKQTETRTRFKALASLTLCALLLFLTGCAAALIGGGVAAGVGGYAYIKGELKVTEDAALDRVWAAAHETSEEMGYVVTEEKKDSQTARLEARTAESKSVHFQMKSLAENSTEIRIRIGTFGDEVASRQLLEKIKEKT